MILICIKTVEILFDIKSVSSQLVRQSMETF
jgi:hypothetical protein